MRKRLLMVDHENTDLDRTILVLPPRPHVAAPCMPRRVFPISHFGICYETNTNIQRSK